MSSGVVMILLPGNTKTFKRAVKLNPDYFGWLITPRRVLASTAVSIPGARWAADNECYALGDQFDSDVYIKMLDRYSKWSGNCIFATAPDVLGNVRATLDKFEYWRQVINGMGYPVALVGQDGLENEVVPWQSFDALFIGGSTDWKLSQSVRDLITEAKEYNKWVHVGRVNSRSRLTYCLKLGVDSVDGTTWGINPDSALAWAFSVLETLSYQKELPLCYTSLCT